LPDPPHLQEADVNLGKLLEMVEATLDLDELQHHNFVIKADYDDKLRRIKTSLDAVRDNLDDEHRRVGKQLNIDITKRLHLENHSSYGYCFRVTRTVRMLPELSTRRADPPHQDAKVLSNDKKSYREIATTKVGEPDRVSLASR
jgi:DNA mismatch repair protein MSH2